MRKDEVLQILRQHWEDLATQFNVKSLAIFGSVARDEAGPESDIDILVEFDRPVGFFTFIGLQEFLEGILGRSVDLATPDALRKEWREDILREAIRAA